MSEGPFVYTIYIATTPAVLWKALLDGQFTRQYWAHDNVSDWKPGSSWEHRRSDGTGTVDVVGRIVESNPPGRLVMTWADPQDRDRPERHSRVTFEIEQVADMTRLTVTHEDAAPDMRRKIASGWPRVLSSLKTLLETGCPLDTWAARQEVK